MATIRVRDQIDLSTYERSYLPEIFRGLFLTIARFFANIIGLRKRRGEMQTLRYPDEKRIYPERFRGQHRLLMRDDGTPRCVACYMCSTACPAYCIHIVAGESPTQEVEKYPVSFEIDMLRCVYCGLCEEACPEDAIRMDTGIHTPAFLNRDQGVVGRVNLLELMGQNPNRLAYGAQNAREDRPASQA